ncbi:hypothetical protein HID58_071376 [Brassica napus]|uniref:Uncharacterized protein n=1 Tax=Brassica napus TaxID=3708 RepID=A0ABQ7Z1I9_BRANA|nr:hypothetical protein HID58_071376 [Brassica napus]
MINITGVIGTSYLGVARNVRFCTQIDTFEVVDAGASTPFTIAFKMNRCLMTLMVTIWWSGSIQRIPIKLLSLFRKRGMREAPNRIIDKAMRNMITSFRYKADHKFAGLMCRWFKVTA